MLTQTRMCPASRLVCGNRPERCLLSCLDLLMAQTCFYDSPSRIRHISTRSTLSGCPCSLVSSQKSQRLPLPHSLRVSRWEWCRGTHHVAITPICHRYFSPWSFLWAGVLHEQMSRHLFSQQIPPRRYGVPCPMGVQRCSLCY